MADAQTLQTVKVRVLGHQSFSDHQEKARDCKFLGDLNEKALLWRAVERDVDVEEPLVILAPD